MNSNICIARRANAPALLAFGTLLGKSDILARGAALRELFGAQKISGWQPIEGGVSGAPIFHFDVQERAYVVGRVSRRPCGAGTRAGIAARE